MALENPGEVMKRLADIEGDLAIRQPAFEDAARKHYIAKRDKEKARAVAFLAAEGHTVAERQAIADQQTATDGSAAEAEYEAMKAVMRTLEARASIGQSLLRVQSNV